MAQDGEKRKSSLMILGCTFAEFQEHIQKQFKSDMAWNNYGKWHIDHIRPCASFDLLDPEEQKKCFHYTNLQPLWAEENMKKHAKWNKDQLATQGMVR